MAPGVKDNKVWTALFALALLFGAVRLAAALGDLYIDEVWSLYFARSPWSEIFLIRHDNNHLLNTLYMRALGDSVFFLNGAPVFLSYRLLSIISGTLSLVVLGYIGLQRGRLEAFTLVTLAGLSYPLVLYSSEARGYAPAVFFALLAFVLAGRWLKERSWPILILFWISTLLGMLSHFSFVYAFAGIAAWSFFQGLGQKDIKGALLINSVPLLVVALLYLFFIRGLNIGGGEETKIWQTALDAAASVSGIPGSGYISLALGALFTIVFVSAGIASLRKSGQDQWIFLLTAILIAPVAVMLLTTPEFSHFRYFLVSFPFFYILIAAALSRAFRASSLGKAFYAGFMLFFAVSNLYMTGKLIQGGRGDYFKAVQFISENTPGQTAVVGSDHAFRNRMMLLYYSKFLPEGKGIAYAPSGQWPANGPDWIVRHNIDPAAAQKQSIKDEGVEYALAASYPYSGSSGWAWHLYKRAGKIY